MISDVQGKVYTVTAADVTQGDLTVQFPGMEPSGAMVVVRSNLGVVKAWDGLYTASSAGVFMDNSGTVDWADGDEITVLAIP